jgi:hypothetical protein
VELGQQLARGRAAQLHSLVLLDHADVLAIVRQSTAILAGHVERTGGVDNPPDDCRFCNSELRLRVGTPRPRYERKNR